MSDHIAVRRVDPAVEDIERLAGSLADVLIDCVEGGASVGFMLPLERHRATAFWEMCLAGAAGGDRILFVAEEPNGVVVGTVQVVVAMPENQPHRGELVKMLVHRRARRRGVGEALLAAAERAAMDAGKTLLVLDTANDAAARLYHRAGWIQVGIIPDYALWPHGGLCDTIVFHRRLAP